MLTRILRPSPRGLPLLVCIALSACVSSEGANFISDESGESGENVACPTVPVAYVFPEDTGGSELPRLLADAGFEVQELPLNRSPRELAGLIALPSYVGAQEDYAQYMSEYAQELYAFVDQANVLLQLTQDDEHELEPPFLPSTHGALRSDDTASTVQIASSASPLLLDVAQLDGELSWHGDVGREIFAQQGGFEVMLSAAGEAAHPVLMEGAYGQGRILLSAMAFDRQVNDNDTERQAFAQTLSSNLVGHVRSVCQRDAPPLTPTASDQAQVPFESNSWMLAVLPDTQVYSLRYPGMFDTQTSWIAREAEDLNIRFVAHLGDVVNNNSAEEWERARDAMSMLDTAVPYSIAPGNHDYGPSGDASTRETLLNEYFDFGTGAAQPSFGGAFVSGQLDNTYHLFEAGGQEWILMSLEWGPRDEVIDWANEVMAQHSDRLGIFVTHAYLNHNDRRYDHTDDQNQQAFNPYEYDTPGGVNDGEELWQKLVRHHNFVITLNGHVLGDGTGYLESQTDTGVTCHQMLSNFQMRELGGEGFMRLLEFRTDGSVMVRSYSPLHDSYLTEYDQQFDFWLD